MRKNWRRKATLNLTFKFNKKLPYLLLDTFHEKGVWFAYNNLKKLDFFRRRRFFYKLKNKRKFFRLTKKKLATKNFNFVKYINFSKFISTLSSNKNNFSLINRVFLNERRIKNQLSFFFYKKVKYKLLPRSYSWNKNKITLKVCKNIYAGKKFHVNPTQKLICLNYNKLLYWKIRKSRITHWNGVTAGNLNKRRYENLLPTIVRQRRSSTDNCGLVFVLYHLSRLPLTWRQIYLLSYYQLFVINGKFLLSDFELHRGDILEFCYGIGLGLHRRIYTHLNNKIVYRLKRWSYKTHLAYKKFDKNGSTKKIPKSVRSVGLSYQPRSRFFIYAKSLGLVAILRSLPKQLHIPTIDIYKNTLLKLNSWRYKF